MLFSIFLSFVVFLAALGLSSDESHDSLLIVEMLNFWGCSEETWGSIVVQEGSLKSFAVNSLFAYCGLECTLAEVKIVGI